MQEQHTAPPAEEERTYPEFDRRRGPRRAGANGEVDSSFERRQGDRRKKKPGFAGLIGAIFGHNRAEEPTEV
ncbi:MAG TPA: hypothetical protein VHS78_15270 [Candidatus Elarobacter sp.]|jgi:hypothetical protein|nr:hypothetical protein [Candidatus Elarobacter sp.]